MLNYIIPIFLIICVGCRNYGSETTLPVSDSVRNSIVSEGEEIHNYKYFDLFKMQGIMPWYDNSGVTVTKKDESLKIDAYDPDTSKKYSMTVYNRGDYWYSWAAISKDDYSYLSKSDSCWRYQYDTFIMDDIIFQYVQDIGMCDARNHIVIKKPETYSWILLKDGIRLGTDPDNILSRIKKIVNGDERSAIEKRVDCGIIRTDSVAQLIIPPRGYVDDMGFPETKVWGGKYGL